MCRRGVGDEGSALTVSCVRRGRSGVVARCAERMYAASAVRVLRGRIGAALCPLLCRAVWARTAAVQYGSGQRPPRRVLYCTVRAAYGQCTGSTVYSVRPLLAVQSRAELASADWFHSPRQSPRCLKRTVCAFQWLATTGTHCTSHCFPRLTALKLSCSSSRRRTAAGCNKLGAAC